MPNVVNMDDILKASFGETSSTIRASFKKTINIKQYETEVIELSTVLDVGKPLNGIERMLMSAILQSQLEYEAYIQMRCKGIIGDSQLADRKKELEQDVNLLKSKGEALTGKSMDYIFDLSNGDVNV
jgi:hypothetical protein